MTVCPFVIRFHISWFFSNYLFSFPPFSFPLFLFSYMFLPFVILLICLSFPRSLSPSVPLSLFPSSICAYQSLPTIFLYHALLLFFHSLMFFSSLCSFFPFVPLSFGLIFWYPSSILFLSSVFLFPAVLFLSDPFYSFHPFSSSSLSSLCLLSFFPYFPFYCALSLSHFLSGILSFYLSRSGAHEWCSHNIFKLTDTDVFRARFLRMKMWTSVWNKKQVER